MGTLLVQLLIETAKVPAELAGSAEQPAVVHDYVQCNNKKRYGAVAMAPHVRAFLEDAVGPTLPAWSSARQL